VWVSITGRFVCSFLFLFSEMKIDVDYLSDSMVRQRSLRKEPTHPNGSLPSPINLPTGTRYVAEETAFTWVGLSHTSSHTRFSTHRLLSITNVVFLTFADSCPIKSCPSPTPLKATISSIK